jgi:predicted 3-demethylubiquinone-9 3-methyltransferase (glyoxalase superfamily)
MKFSATIAVLVTVESQEEAETLFNAIVRHAQRSASDATDGESSVDEVWIDEIEEMFI